jgi:hypothetical protein
MMVCIYCGMPCEFWCRDCGENHLVTEEEFDAYHGNDDAKLPKDTDVPQ